MADRVKSPTVPVQRWWSYPRGSPAVGGAVVAGVNSVQETTLGLQQRFLRAARLFGGYGYMSSGRFATSTASGGPLGQGARSGPRDNIVYSIITTVCSQLWDDGAPSVSFAPNHGDYEIQEKAQKLEEFNDGISYQVDLDETEKQIDLDTCIFGTSFLKHYLDADDNICNERVFPSEIFIDIWDGRDMRPRTLYQVGFVDRDVLAARYPKRKKQILESHPQQPIGFSNVNATSVTNVIPFLEAWHLPTSRDGSDGRHILCLSDDCIIIDEGWEDTDFPFTVLRFELLPTGFHGLGIAELLQGDQLSLNDANRAEYWAWSQVAAPRLFMQSGSLDKNHLNSSLSGIILEGTVAPQVLNWSATHPDFVEWKKDLKAEAFAKVGVSPMAAGSIKPAGLNSGEAQRVFADRQHSRFAVFSQRRQEWRVEVARKNVALARRAYANTGHYKVKVLGKNFLREIDFKDCDLAEDEYRLQALPISSLPKSVAGRIQTATELMQASLIDQDTGRKLLKLPDLDEAMSLQNAAYDNARRTSYLMLHEGRPMQPDPLQNLLLCQKIVTADALRALDNNAPKERIDLARAYLVQLKAMLQPPAPVPAPPGAPGAGPGPIAQGASAPPSSVLPFKPPPGAMPNA